MSVRIEGNQNLYRTKEDVQVKEAQKKENSKENVDAFAPKDTYESSEKSGKATGLYQLKVDEEGKKKVFFDDPKKSEIKGEEKCTTDTSQVDREIRKLKEEVKHLKQQIKNADPEEKKRLEQRLAQAEMKLSQKDNDSYRKQNAKIS